MSEIGQKHIGEKVSDGTNHRYRFVPFLAGLVECTLDLSKINPQPIHEALMGLDSGVMPARGGFVETPDGLAAIDAVACEFSGDELRLFPTLKKLVTSSGDIVGDTAIAYQTENGLIRIIGFNYDIRSDPFRADRTGIPEYARGKTGRITERIDPSVFGDFEFDDTHKGSVIAQPRLKIY